MLLAVPLLKERVTPAGWALALLGFSGVLLILRPGGGLDPWGVVFALINAAGATAFHLLTRSLTRTETTIAMLFHVTLVGTLAFGFAALPQLAGPMPAPLDLAAMALLGVLATSGHFLFALAYREAPASLVAPVNYLHVVWAALLGWLFYGHLPDVPALAGMAMIVAAGVLLALRAHLAGQAEKRRLARPPQRVPLAPE
jgi:drug/metabolite transporter (DMT)-like permease